LYTPFTPPALAALSVSRFFTDQATRIRRRAGDAERRQRPAFSYRWGRLSLPIG